MGIEALHTSPCCWFYVSAFGLKIGVARGIGITFFFKK